MSCKTVFGGSRIAMVYWGMANNTCLMRTVRPPADSSLFFHPASFSCILSIKCWKCPLFGPPLESVQPRYWRGKWRRLIPSQWDSRRDLATEQREETMKKIFSLLIRWPEPCWSRSRRLSKSVMSAPCPCMKITTSSAKLRWETGMQPLGKA